MINIQNTVSLTAAGHCEAVYTLPAGQSQSQSLKEEVVGLQTWPQSSVKASCLYRQFPKFPDRDITGASPVPICDIWATLCVLWEGGPAGHFE